MKKKIKKVINPFLSRPKELIVRFFNKFFKKLLRRPCFGNQFMEDFIMVKQHNSLQSISFRDIWALWASRQQTRWDNRVTTQKQSPCIQSSSLSDHGHTHRTFDYTGWSRTCSMLQRFHHTVQLFSWISHNPINPKVDPPNPDNTFAFLP